MKIILQVTVGFFALFFAYTTQGQNNEGDDSFTFAFLTDIHLQPEENAVEGFRLAIDKVNELNPDFVITGGDLLMDVLSQSYNRSDSMYKLYMKEIKRFKMPVYNTMGNHDIYGIYDDSGADKSNPEYGEKMFEKRLGKSYYSFEHKGRKFMILNTIEGTNKNKYVGMIDSVQIKWIKKEISETDKSQPIVISTHIPFITAFKQRYYGTTLANDSNLVISNGKEVIDLFNDHNLTLVLQGHLHIVEDILIDNIHFVTGGAISANWWKGPNKSFEEGFMMIRVKGDKFEWEYIDYGWEVKLKK